MTITSVPVFGEIALLKQDSYRARISTNCNAWYRRGFLPVPQTVKKNIVRISHENKVHR